MQRKDGYGLNFLDSGKLFKAVEQLVSRVNHAKSNLDVHSNVIDPFAAFFDASLVAGLGAEDWLGAEKSRQIQKSLTNAIGDFHQELIGALPGWTSTGKSGGVVDLIHEGAFGARKAPAIAEVKNKFNTLNSKGQKELHSTFQGALEWPSHKNYSAYLIEIIPRRRPGTDEPWAPAGRGVTDKIRKISAALVYKESSGGDERAIEKVFDVLPLVLEDVVGNTPELSVVANDEKFKDFFKRAI